MDIDEKLIEEHLKIVNSCMCPICRRHRRMFIEWLNGYLGIKTIEPISTILPVKDLRFSNMKVGDIKIAY